MYKYLLPLLFSLLLLSSCNLRENSLLPPNLDPKDYVQANTILLLSDYLVKSSNDDSFLYIPKDNIREDALIYGDKIELRRSTALIDSDSLAFAQDAAALSYTYQITITRGGQNIWLDSDLVLGSIYTTLLRSANPAHARLVQLAPRLRSKTAEIHTYGKNRCFFDISGTTQQALMDLGTSDSIRLNASAKDTQALLSRQNGDIYFWLPAPWRSSPATITVSDSLSQPDHAICKSLFPGFILKSPVISVQTAYSGDAVPIIRIQNGGKGSFDTQWTKISGSNIQGWPSGEDTWLYDQGELVSFLQGEGHYFLLSPLADQSSVSIPLDGSFSRVYLQDLWLDTKGVKQDGLRLVIDLQPQLQKLLDDYFSGSPFTLKSSPQAFSLSLWQGSVPLESLNAGQWFELGIRAKNPGWETSRLTRVYRDFSQDIISYQTFASAYDATHFSQADGFIYTSITGSGSYLLAPVFENTQILDIPCLKSRASIQTQPLYLSWDAKALNCNKLSFDFTANLSEPHPWLQGYPYTLAKPKALLKIEARGSGGSLQKLPDNLFLSRPLSYRPQAVINFLPSSTYPQWYRYQAGQSFEHNGFVMKGNTMQISPATPGYIFDAANLSHPAGAFNLRAYSSMTWDERDYEIYLSSSLPMPSGSLISISPQKSFTDRLGILASQYQLSPLGGVYDFKILANPNFYNSFQPLIRIRQADRRANQLFSISDGEYCRIYPYIQGSKPDGWHFSISDGHIWFYLSHDGEYGATSDLNPHSQIETTATSATKPLIASLYQAQLDIPAQLIGNSLPLGAKVQLSEASNAPANAIGARRVGFFNASGQTINPNFYDVPLPVPVPYIYVPVENFSPGMSLRMFYRSPSGAITEFTRVQSFSPDPVDEFMVIGNCALCFVNNPGLFYLTQ